MIKYLLLFLALIYIYTIIRNFIKIKEIDAIIDVIEKYMSSVNVNSYGHYTFDNNYNECINLLLRYYPKIVNCLGFYTPPLEYGASPRENHINASRIYSKIFMERNYAVESFRQSFNPVVSIKKFLSIPSTFLEWIGFSFGSNFGKIVNLLGWLLAYFLNLYGEEIKVLISSLLNQ